MALRSSSTNSGTSQTPSTAVPAGVQTGDIVILVCSFDAAAETFTGKWPSGFTQLYDSTVTSPDGHSVGVGWKRLTGSDSGSYTFDNPSVSQDWICQAYAFSGRHATNDPVATAVEHATGESTPVSITASGVTAVAGDDLLWLSAPDVTASGNGAGHTAPTNYTEQHDVENGWTNLSGAYRENVSAGATGDITGSFALSSGTAGWIAYLVRIPSVSATFEQEGYRFRNDDGSETGATWAANQDTGMTAATGTNKRLRVLVNATGDPVSAPYQLQYKKSTDTDWKTVH